MSKTQQTSPAEKSLEVFREPDVLETQVIREVDYRERERELNPELMRYIDQLEAMSKRQAFDRMKDHALGFVLGIGVTFLSFFLTEWTAYAAPWLLPPKSEVPQSSVKEYLVRAFGR